MRHSITATFAAGSLLFSILAIGGCQGSNSDRDMSSNDHHTGSAQVGSGTDTGTSGVSSGEVAPSTRPSNP